MPRPYGKSLVGIVIDEPIDADAPAFATPQRPEDLLDAVDDEDEDEDEAEGEEDDEDEPTTFYDARAGKYTGPGRPAGAEAPVESEPAEAAASVAEAEPAERASKTSRRAASVRPNRTTRSNRPASKKGSQMSAASGQALAAALALAVAALVTLFVRYQKDQEHKNQEAAASVPGAREDTKECVSSFFANGSFKEESELDFVCHDADLRSIVEEVERRIKDDAAGGPSESVEAWEELDWYQLALTASLRRHCCTSSGSAVKLPGRQGDCAGLASTIPGTDQPAQGAELASQTHAFERAATCLAQRGDQSPYPYRSAPKTSSRKAFGDFLQRRASQQARAQ
jgi:hypothetical protein